MMKNNSIQKQTFIVLVVFCILTIGILFGTTTIAQQNNSKRQSNGLDSSVITEEINADSHDSFLKLSVETKERYYLGEAPIIKFVLTNTGGEQKVLEAEHWQFQVRGEGIFNNGDGVQEVKDFDYKGSFEFPPTEPKHTKKVLYTGFEFPKRKEPTYVMLKLGETTGVDINLSGKYSTDLFYPGKYKLIATMKGSELKAVAEFEVYFDEEKSTPILEQKLRENGNGSGMAFHLLREYNRPKLITVLEDMLQADNEMQRKQAIEQFGLLKQMDQYEMKKRKQ